MTLSTQASPSDQPSLALSGISKTYKGGLKALDDINFSVPRGQFFALLGPNGAGKSTMISIVSSLIRPTQGSVKIFGIDLAEQPSAAKQKLGVVPQEFNFNQFEKVFDIVVTQAGYYGIARSEAAVRAEKYLKQLGLWDKRDIQSRNLSGGMKRRLMIARAMVHNPDLLILDEPTAGVDIEIRRSMWDFLQKINQEGTTTILTTHYLEEAEQLCREIAILDHGKVVEHTTMKDLLGKLSVETFLMDLSSPVSKAPELIDGDIRLVDPTTLEVTLDKSVSINHVFDQLSQQKVLVQSMRNKANRLEELFMRLVESPNTDQPAAGGDQ